MDIRKLALKLLTEYEVSGKYVNLSLASHSADGLSQEERGMLTALLYTTVERRLSFDYYICALSGRSLDKVDSHTANIIRLGLCQVLFMDRIPDFAAVNETVKLCRNKGEGAFVNAVLRAAVKRKGDMPLPDKGRNAARYYSVLYSLPIDVVRHFISLLGEGEAVKLFECFNKTAPTTLTVNTARISREALISRLAEAGIPARPSSLSPISVCLEGSVNPRLIPGFSEGLFFVQDEASALAALALEAGEGDNVLDICSAPGGKSFAIAISASDKARITALDLRESKLSLITGGAERLGIRGITVGCADAAVPNPDFLASFDRVLCDVPCSGLGVIGKKPDLRYNSAGAMKSLPPLQGRILSVAASYVRAGGVLVYSTCTLNPEENEETVKAFLSVNPDFSPVPFSVGDITAGEGMITLYPHVHGTDGFFIAKLRKNI
jgi:16S rRNA (cytosine967-C5)-methyltransferase